MPPSDRHTFRFGYGLSSPSMSLPENSQSTVAETRLVGARLPVTSSGASGEVLGIDEDEPKWMHSGMAVSSAAASSGSQ